MPEPPRFTILLCTCQGAAHLAEQLHSYLAQTHGAWDLWVSDDGSTDDSRAIVETFRARHGTGRDIRLLDGPGAGPVANFMSLLTHPDLPPGPVALSDQDDVWFPDKLERARAALADSAPVTLYGAQSVHTDQALNRIGHSRLPHRAACFANALTQNIVSGHSTVLSAGALDLVRRAGPPQGVPYHDWWLYQLVSGAGGTVKIDPEQVLFYRQHGNNAMGAHQGAGATLRRAGQVLGQTYGRWIAANLAALERVSHLLTPENRALLDAIRALQTRGGPRRALGLARLGLHRQTQLASAAFFLTAALGRI